MSCWALVPVKARAEGKSRLARVLTDEARVALVRSMLGHVLEVLATAPGIDHVAVVSPERDTVPDDVLVLNEQGRGLNRALGRGIAALNNLGAREVLVVPGDLPLLTAGDVAQMLAGTRAAGCALACDGNRTGTNAIGLDFEQLGGVAFRFLFGRDSFGRHCRQAATLGLGPRLVSSAGLAFDLDEPESLRQFQSGEIQMDDLRRVS